MRGFVRGSTVLKRGFRRIVQNVLRNTVSTRNIHSQIHKNQLMSKMAQLLGSRRIFIYRLLLAVRQAIARVAPEFRTQPSLVNSSVAAFRHVKPTAAYRGSSTLNKVTSRSVFANRLTGEQFFWTHEDLRKRLDNRLKGIILVSSRSILPDKIRRLFVSKIHTECSVNDLPSDINGYEIGGLVGYGCNAAVYEAAEKPRRTSETSCQEDGKQSKPYVLKMMYNFNFNRPAEYLWQDHRREMLPLACDGLTGSMNSSFVTSRTHPNIIQIHTAFLGEWKQLAGAECYSGVLPTVENYGILPSIPMTLYLVMQRYRMTLKEYMEKIRMNYAKFRVIFGQILEAIVFLYDEKISHRDLKTDNILLNFSAEEEFPHVAVCDFGCAFSSGSWKLHYTDSDMDLGGNIDHRPPEVTSAHPSPHTWIDFSKADVWAAGLIGYEIFDRTITSLQEQNLEDNTASSSEPFLIGSAVGRIMEDMLQKDYEERANPHIAANVVNINLFCLNKTVSDAVKDYTLGNVVRGSHIMAMLDSSSALIKAIGQHVEQGLDDLISLWAAGAVLSHRQDAVLTQIRSTFLSRFDREYFFASADYFQD